MRSLKQTSIGLVVLVLAFILIYRLAVPATIQGGARAGLFSVGSIFYKSGVGLKNFWSGLVNGRQWRAELDQEQARVAELSAANANLQTLAKDNEELRRLLALPARRPVNILAADILGFNVFFKKHTLTINRGRADGVKENFPVVAPAGVLIGKTANLTEHTADVLLTTDDASSITGSPASAPDIKTIIKGKAGISLVMELIPQTAALAVGDLVVTSSLEENTPPGWLLGRVAAVAYKDGQLFKQADLEPIIDASRLTSVGVILPWQ